MNVHLEPITFLLRLYADGKSFENYDDFDLVATVMVMGKTAFLAGVKGKMTREAWFEISKALREMGFERAVALRHGKERWYSTHDGRIIASNREANQSAMTGRKGHFPL